MNRSWTSIETFKWSVTVAGAWINQLPSFKFLSFFNSLDATCICFPKWHRSASFRMKKYILRQWVVIYWLLSNGLSDTFWTFLCSLHRADVAHIWGRHHWSLLVCSDGWWGVWILLGDLGIPLIIYSFWKVHKRVFFALDDLKKILFHPLLLYHWQSLLL